MRLSAVKTGSCFMDEKAEPCGIRLASHCCQKGRAVYTDKALLGIGCKSVPRRYFYAKK